MEMQTYKSFESEVEYSFTVDKGRSHRFMERWRALDEPASRIALAARSIMKLDPIGFNRMQADGEEAVQYTLEAIAVRHPILFETTFPEALIVARWRLQIPDSNKAA